MGHKASLGNMLRRSFGSGDFAGFWRHWNPVWSYALGRFINRPLASLLPASMALFVTFVASGFIHDLVIMALRGQFALLFTPWFGLMSLLLLTGWKYTRYDFTARALINFVQIAVPFAISLYAMARLQL